LKLPIDLYERNVEIQLLRKRRQISKAPRRESDYHPVQGVYKSIQAGYTGSQSLHTKKGIYKQQYRRYMRRFWELRFLYWTWQSLSILRIKKANDQAHLPLWSATE